MAQNADHPAVVYHAAGFHTFPVKLDKKTGRKIPCRKEWNTEPLAERPTNDPCWGARIPKGWLVIDVDTKRYSGKASKGAESWESIKALIKGGLPGGVYAVSTMSGGMHWYFRVDPNAKIRKTNPLFPNVDFLSEGHYVVGPGTDFIGNSDVLPYSVVQGELNADYDIQAPDELLAYIVQEPSHTQYQRESFEYSDDPHVIAQVIDYIKRSPAAIQGDSGDHTTYTLACFGHDRGVKPETMLDLLYDHYNPRCQPQWSYQELSQKVDNAYKYAQNGAGSQNYAHLMDANDDEAIEEMLCISAIHGVVWPRTASGAFVTNNEDIVINFLTTRSAENFRNALWNIFRYNELTHEVEYTRVPPWADPMVSNQNDPRRVNATVDETELSCIRRYFSQVFHYNCKIDTVYSAVLHVAKRNRYNPIVMWLRSLRWDGIKRLNSWGPMYLDCPDDHYHRRVCALWMKGAVQRMLKPGCTWQYVPILEGPQGCGKSRTVRLLSRRPEWFAAISPDTDKDTKMVMGKKWIIELAEIDSLSKREAAHTKAFIDNEVDTMRLPYGRMVADFPRHSIFVGTVNPNSSGQYLNDATGGRRYWPIECGHIDHMGLEEVVDQLYAEAYHELVSNDSVLYMSEADESLARRAQKERLEADPFVDLIDEYWMSHPEKEGIQLIDLYVEMGGNVTTFNSKVRKRMVDSAGYLGCRLDGKSKGVMRPPGYAPLEPIEMILNNFHPAIQALRARLTKPVEWSIDTVAFQLTRNLDIKLERPARIALGMRLSQAPGVERGRSRGERYWRISPL